MSNKKSPKGSDNSILNDTQSNPLISDPLVIAAGHQRQVGAVRPERIGPYKILETLGEGGMGTVYLAEQTNPVHRRVALKIIKLGMDTKQTIARFEAEREALALMNHPGVAKVFDAGVSDEGRPYFVMEYVPGISITDYCDRTRLCTNDRLQLFMQVCHAVQHAHQKGIIHRDIKPSNILVAEQDGIAAPKVIDFGVAKATQQHFMEHTLFTEKGQMIGTPGYMSPEQAEMSALDVDTRTDIYSLGVLLYELLVGIRPFDDEDLKRAGFVEIQRIIREVEPLKPSTRLSSKCVISTQIARKRRTEIHTLSRLLRGDLDWIVMKCLEKDRNRRYDTANALAIEIQRYLGHQPVLAGPPNATYRFRKFLHRNKGPVLAVAAIVLALVVGIMATGLMYLQALTERDRAVVAELLTAESLQETDAAREDAEAVTKFLIETLAAVNPEKQGKDISVREVLVGAATRIREEFIDKPLIQAKLHYTVGTTFYSLGLFDEAQLHLADAAALYYRLNGEQHPSTLQAAHALSAVLIKRGKFNAAEARLFATLETKRRVLGEQHVSTLRSTNSLASLYSNQGRYAEAEPLFLKTLEIRKRVLGEEDNDTLTSMNNLASLYKDQSRFTEAESLFIKTLEISQRVLGMEHPKTLSSMNNLANLYSSQGRYSESEPLYLKTLEISKRVFGMEHPKTLNLTNSLASLYSSQGRYAEAEPLYLTTLETSKRVLGTEHPLTLNSMIYLANLYQYQGHYTKAEPLILKTLEISKRVLGEQHPDTLVSMNNLADLYNNQDRYAEAEPLFLKTLEIRKRVLGEQHSYTLTSMNNLASLYLHQGRYAEAEPIAAKVVADAQNILPPQHPHLAVYRSTNGQVLLKLGRLEEAERLLLDSYAVLSVVGNLHKDAIEVAHAMVELSESRHIAEPHKGFDKKTTEWRARLAELEIEGEPAPTDKKLLGN